MKITKELVRLIATRINTEFNLAIEVNGANGGLRVECDGGSANLSGRLTTRETYDWLNAYRDGLRTARDSGLHLHPFTLAMLHDAPRHSADERDNRDAISANHPFMAAMDALLRMAHDCIARHGHAIAEDSYAGSAWRETAASLHSFNSMDFGRVANIAIERVYWEAVRVAGFTDAEMES